MQTREYVKTKQPWNPDKVPSIKYGEQREVYQERRREHLAALAPVHGSIVDHNQLSP